MMIFSLRGSEPTPLEVSFRDCPWNGGTSIGIWLVIHISLVGQRQRGLLDETGRELSAETHLGPMRKSHRVR